MGRRAKVIHKMVTCPRCGNKYAVGFICPYCIVRWVMAKDVRSFNVGSSDYAKHKIQPWDIWIEYHLNPFDADIVKRVLRTKQENGMNEREARILDYEKIKHICDERIRQLTTGESWEGE